MKTLTIPRIADLAADDLFQSIMALLDQGAEAEVNTVNWPEAMPDYPAAMINSNKAYLGYNATHLFVFFTGDAPTIRAEHFGYQLPVSQDTCAEIFIQPQSCDEYWNFEFNLIGSINASHRRKRPEPVRLTETELDTIEIAGAEEPEAFGERENAEPWMLAVAIPFELMGIKPAKGMRLAANIYMCSSKSAAPYWLTWNPVGGDKPDFHRPADFGQLILG